MTGLAGVVGGASHSDGAGGGARGAGLPSDMTPSDERGPAR